MVASPDFGAGTADHGMHRRSLDVPPNLANVEFRLVDAAMLYRVSPDFIQIILCARRNLEAARHVVDG
jgi:hypothetical protein